MEETLSSYRSTTPMFSESEGAVSIIGAIYGLLFLAYAVVRWIHHDDIGWSKSFRIGCVVTGPSGSCTRIGEAEAWEFDARCDDRVTLRTDFILVLRSYSAPIPLLYR